jgi:5'-deoxynucleotidase YfbR-like HD superfamily hydrolase
VIGDLISPFKAAIGLDYKAFELRLLSAIHTRFGIPALMAPQITAAIKDADRVAAYFEATVLAGFHDCEAQTFFGSPSISDRLTKSLRDLVPLPANAAEQKFLELFYSLARYSKSAEFGPDRS